MTGAAITVRPLAADHYAIDVRGHELEVDQPVASGGTDLAPTPSELFVASIASCAAFYVGRFLRRHGEGGGPWSVRCAFHWSEEKRSYIDRIVVELVLPPTISDEVRAGALRAADHCTVRESIRWGVEIEVTALTTEPVLA